MLGRLWAKAKNIPYEPATRILFDWTLNLLGVTSFRIGKVINMPYSQVELSVVRNPSDPIRTTLVVTIHLEHSKQETNAVKGAQNHKSVNLPPCSASHMRGENSSNKSSFQTSVPGNHSAIQGNLSYS